MSEKGKSSKYLYLNTIELELLMQKALDSKMYFKHPNEVLRDVLGFPENTKRRKRQRGKTGLQSQEKKSSRRKTPVDKDVWSAWKLVRAKAGGQSASPRLIQQAIEWFHEQRSEAENQEIIGKAIPRRPGGRPPTR